MDKTRLTSNGHTEYCNRWRARYSEELIAYEAAHPNYCRTCKGRGGREYHDDPSPAGVGLSSGYYIEVDPCHDCVELGKCPVCAKTIDDDGERCYHCGWKMDDGNKTVAPHFECCCWEVAIEEQDYDPTPEERKTLDEIYADLLAEKEADAFEAYVDGVRPEDGEL